MVFSRFERLVAIPEMEYAQLKSSKQLSHPLQNHFTELSKDYNQQAAILNPYERIHHQGETLNEMINVKDEIRKSLLNSTPRPYQSRAEGLLKYMSDKVEFNVKGELKDASGNIIGGSNVTDLIQHAVRDRRRNMTPAGWSYFKDRLLDSNAPNMLLNYETLDEIRNPTKLTTAPIIKLGHSADTKALKTEKFQSPTHFKQAKRLRNTRYPSSSGKIVKRRVKKKEYIDVGSPPSKRMRAKPSYLQDYQS